MNQKDQKMSTPLTIAHVVILLANFSIVALGVYINLMMPEHPAMNLEIALGSGFFLGITIPALIGLRSYKGTAKGLTLTMCLVTGQAVFILWFFSKDLTASYLSIFLSMVIGLSSAIFVIDLQFLRKISRMSFNPNLPKSAAIGFIVLLLTPPLAAVFAVGDFRYCNPLEEQALTFADQLIPTEVPGTIERTVTETDTIALAGMDLSFSLSHYFTVENGSQREYVQIKGILRPANETGFYIVQTPAFALTSLMETQEVEPLYEEVPKREDWKGITMITTESHDIFVKYDHVDNGPYMPPTYEIHPDEVGTTPVEGSNAVAIHIPKHMVEEIRQRGNLVIGGQVAATAGLALLMKIIQELAKKLSIILLGLYDIALILAKLVWDWFIDNIMKSEMEDSWFYFHNPGSYWIFRWVSMGIGAWRDSPNLTLIWIDEPPPPPVTETVDAYIIAWDDTYEEKAPRIGGLGQGTHGPHVYDLMSVAAFVADEEGDPVEGQSVHFVFSPGGRPPIALWLTTNETGIAQSGIYDLSSMGCTWPGVYALDVATYGDAEDTTDYTYEVCRLTEGQTLDRGAAVEITSTRICDEFLTYTITAAHLKLYFFSHWVVNNKVVAIGVNPYYIWMNTDKMAVAHQSLLDIAPYPNGDKKIDIRDIATVAKAFATQPGHPRWKEIADIYVDGRVDIKDIAAMAKHWAEQA